MRIWCPWHAQCLQMLSFVLKAEQGRSDEINTCIGCNQACLDHNFLHENCNMFSQPTCML